MSGSVLRASIHFRNSSADTVHLSRLPSWVHRYRCCIIYGSKPQLRQSFIFVCPCCCNIFMVGKVWLMNFVMKCAMWTVVESCARLNGVRSIPSQSAMWVRFRLSHYWSIRSMDIFIPYTRQDCIVLVLCGCIGLVFRKDPIILLLFYFLLLMRV